MLHTAQRYSTAVQQNKCAIYKGLPNPKFGKFYFVGSIPASCWDAAKDNGPFSPKGGSKYYNTEAQAIQAAIDGGAQVIQGVDCRVINIAEWKAAA